MEGGGDWLCPLTPDRDLSRPVSYRSQSSLVTKFDTFALSPKPSAQSPRSFYGPDHFPTHSHYHKCQPPSSLPTTDGPIVFPLWAMTPFASKSTQNSTPADQKSWNVMTRRWLGTEMHDWHARVGCDYSNSVITAQPEWRCRRKALILL